ncbi:MAG: hypothetical protein RLZZ384_1498 [Pseudomonadota bacterium]|jgi:hypothetical protein
MVTSRHLNLFGRAHDVGRGHFFEHVMSTPVLSMRRFQKINGRTLKTLFMFKKYKVYRHHNAMVFGLVFF